jgi:(p)ppGpp synthase/HD superfamily hydrolase
MFSSTPLYNATFLSYEELDARLCSYGLQLMAPRILDAYTMAKAVHEHQTRNDGTPYFYHSSRVAKILLDELKIYDTDIVVAALLHDVLEDSKEITRDILEYNFGGYVAYIVETLTKDLKRAELEPDEVDIAHVAQLQSASEDCMVIKLTSRLDNFRCLSFNLKKNPLTYINSTFDRYLPLAMASNNTYLHTLASELRKEANKFLG